MKNFYFDIIGTGKINIIILNGWGIDAKIWFFVIKKLQLHFKFYLIDFLESGTNNKLYPEKIDEIIEILHKKLPQDAIWLGWSIGGLIVNYFALCYPEHVLALINVASSPCFIEKKNWPGIKKNVMKNYYYNLRKKYHRTINSFLDLEQINTQEYSKDISTLKKIVSYQTHPNVSLLKNHFDIILAFDLRLDIIFLNVPILRIYGELDNLVPKKIISILDHQWPQTHSIMIKKSAHAPFITNKNQFCSIILNFINTL